MSSAFARDSGAWSAAHDGGRELGSGLRDVGEVGAEGVVDLAGDVAFETADDFALGLAFGGAAFDVGAGAFAVAHSGDGGQVQSAGGLAGAAAVGGGGGRF